jgi:hypothetical protein
MAHIERRVRNGKVRYRARYRDPAGHERSKSFSRKVDAERWLADIEHAKTRGAWTDPALGKVRLAHGLVGDHHQSPSDHARPRRDTVALARCPTLR